MLKKAKFIKFCFWFSVNISDKPEAPRNLSVREVFADRCTLEWKQPTDDGGAEITGNILNMISVAQVLCRLAIAGS